ncbi:MAG: 5-formyltetrahydrofolate cyclo-ligase [Bauldia sp.]
MDSIQDNATRKAALRQAALARRDALDSDARSSGSAAIAERALALVIAAKPNVVAGYWPIRSEVDPRHLMERLRREGIDLALPRIFDRRELRFLFWDSESALAAGVFGLSEPVSHASEVRPDVILTPLAGFDRAGHRIGYGKGYYDKAIAGLLAGGQRPQLIGLAFSVQEVTEIPAEPHDMRLDWIVTERETLDFVKT